MDDEAQLRWVMRNRSRSDRARPAGAVIARILKEKWSADAERLATVAADLDALVDEEFRDHCRIAGLNNGVLTINVDDPGRVSAIRHRWLTPLQAAMSSRGTDSRVGRILFTVGSTGTTLGE